MSFNLPFTPASGFIILLSAILLFSSGVYAGFSIGSNKEQAAQFKKAEQSVNEAVEQRNATIISVRQMAAENAQLNLKMDQWAVEQQQQHQQFIEKVDHEISSNPTAYRCAIPANGMRLRIEARRRAAAAATASRAHANMRADAATQR